MAFVESNIMDITMKMNALNPLSGADMAVF